MSYCLPVFRGVKQLLLCCCHYVSIIYSLKLYCFRLVPLIYDVMMWALNMQDWLYFFWAYWASRVWAGHEDTDTWHEDTNLCRTCDILTRSLVELFVATLLLPQGIGRWGRRCWQWWGGGEETGTLRRILCTWVAHQYIENTSADHLPESVQWCHGSRKPTSAPILRMSNLNS